MRSATTNDPSRRTKAFVVGMLQWMWSLDTRGAEFIIGSLAMGRGFIWMLPQYQMDAAYYAPMIDLLPSFWWGLIFFFAGALQILAIIINGTWKRSPFLRCAALTVMFVIYAMLAQIFFDGSSGPALQAALTQAQLAVAAAWCIINISAKL